MNKPVINIQIGEAEDKLSKVAGNRTKNIVEKASKELNSENGEFNSNRMWKMKKQLFPNCQDPPTAVLDSQGNLITDSKGILLRFQEEFSYRLRNRDIDEGLEDLKILKEDLCKMRLELTKNSDFEEWSFEQLQRSLDKLQNNKSKDPHGHINELYKNIGRDGKLSLLMMLNQIN